MPGVPAARPRRHHDMAAAAFFVTAKDIVSRGTFKMLTARSWAAKDPQARSFLPAGIL